MTLITVSGSWLIGIAAAPHLSAPLAIIGLLAAIPLAALILWRDDPGLRRIAACGLFLLGSLRYTFSLPDLSDPGQIAKVQALHPHTDHGTVTL